jgi:hypothetical protein
MTVRQEWDWPPERRRSPTKEHPDWAPSPITTKCANAYFGFIYYLEDGVCCDLGCRDLRRALVSHSNRFADALILGRRLPWRRGWRLHPPMTQHRETRRA